MLLSCCNCCCCCSRKGSVRVSSYFFKFFARQRFVPSHIEVRGATGLRALLLSDHALPASLPGCIPLNT